MNKQPLQIKVQAFTHCGKVREKNEDTIAVGTWQSDGSMSSPRNSQHSLDSPVFCIVADGMGGHTSGKIASSLIAKYLLNKARAGLDVAELLDAANRQIYRKMKEAPLLSGMGSTIVGLFFEGTSATWFNVGDSRLYRVRNGFLRQLSIDDSPLETQGQGVPENRVTQAIGGASSFLRILPHIGIEPLRSGWQYLLCSDGLTDFVSLEEIDEVLLNKRDAPIKILFEKAMSAGAPDNISMIFVTVSSSIDI